MSTATGFRADEMPAAQDERPLATYRVTLDCPGGQAVLDVPSFLGPDAAGRRAKWTAIQAGWGDVDEVTVTSVTDGCPEIACDGEVHFTGERDPITGEDIEAGPCPRWNDRGSASTALFLGACIASALLFLAVLAGGQRAMCAVHDNALRYCATPTAEEPAR